MSSATERNRRAFLKAAALSLAAPAIFPIESAWAQSTSLRRTPDQILGPFYPVTAKVEAMDDLTHLPGGQGSAKGQLLEVTGRLLNMQGEPIAGTRIEVWQANAAGRYAHPDDTNPAPLDPNFLGYTSLTTAADGSYRLKTIKPGAYPTGPNTMRPPHIHFEVWGQHDRLITQMYFDGEPLNEKDRFLQSVLRPEALTVKLQPGSDPTGAVIARFDIVIRG